MINFLPRVLSINVAVCSQMACLLEALQHSNHVHLTMPMTGLMIGTRPRLCLPVPLDFRDTRVAVPPFVQVGVSLSKTKYVNNFNLCVGIFLYVALIVRYSYCPFHQLCLSINIYLVAALLIGSTSGGWYLYSSHTYPLVLSFLLSFTSGWFLLICFDTSFFMALFNS